MPTINLVDANSIGYAGQHSVALNSGGFPTQAIYNTLMNLRTLKSKDRDAAFLYLWDDKAHFRFELYPDYKGNRSDTPEKIKEKEEYHLQQPHIKRLLSALGIPQMKVAGFEADDLAYQLTKHFLAKGYRVNLITSDKDWLQMLAPNVTWVDMRLERTCNLSGFAEFTGYEHIHQFVAEKCLVGDTSDNIKGVGGIGEGAAKAIFSRWNTIQDMIAEYKQLGEFTKENLSDKAFSRCRKKLNEFCSNSTGMLNTYVRNQKLMNLAMAPKPESFKTEPGKKDMNEFFDICGEFAFVSVLRQRAIWENLFFAEEVAAA